LRRNILPIQTEKGREPSTSPAAIQARLFIC
jgi:hypothetical protein